MTWSAVFLHEHLNLIAIILPEVRLAGAFMQSLGRREERGIHKFPTQCALVTSLASGLMRIPVSHNKIDST